MASCDRCFNEILDVTIPGVLESLQNGPAATAEDTDADDCSRASRVVCAGRW
jgi:hypothetical protein